MSVNIKLGGKTLNGVTVAQFENADAPGTEIPFYEFGSVPTEEREVERVSGKRGSLVRKLILRELKV